MHPSAMLNAKYFFDAYVAALPEGTRVMELGSQDVNGSIRQVCPDNCIYTGLDMAEGKGVDIVLKDPYDLPFESNSVDVFLSSSCYEHSEFFWLSFLEIMRVLKNDGVFYLNTPSDGTVHRYPVDCWRFYPDSAQALAHWAKRNGFNTAVLETYVTSNCYWNDCVSVFIKDQRFQGKYPKRIVDSCNDFVNGRVFGKKELLHGSAETERQRKLNAIKNMIDSGAETQRKLDAIKNIIDAEAEAEAETERKLDAIKNAIAPVANLQAGNASQAGA